MIDKLSESAGPVVGFSVKGKVTADDIKQLVPEIEALAQKYVDGLYVLMDLQEFTREEVDAWIPDWKFGRQFHNKITKLAIVGDKRWEKWLTAFVDPFYAQEGKYFSSDEKDKAWAWLREGEKLPQ